MNILKKRMATMLFVLVMALPWAATAQSNWTLRNPRPQGNTLNQIIWTGKQWVGVGNNGTIITSPDGDAWTQRASGTHAWLFSLAWSGAQLVAVGDSGAIWTSTDGVSWSPRVSGTKEALKSVAFADTQFVAVGARGTIRTSPDGITWTARVPPGSVNSVAWNGNEFVATGGTDTILTSPDGISWAVQSSGTGGPLAYVTWSGSQWVAVGWVCPWAGSLPVLPTASTGTRSYRNRPT